MSNGITLKQTEAVISLVGRYLQTKTMSCVFIQLIKPVKCMSIFLVKSPQQMLSKWLKPFYLITFETGQWTKFWNIYSNCFDHIHCYKLKALGNPQFNWLHQPCPEGSCWGRLEYGSSARRWRQGSCWQLWGEHHCTGLQSGPWRPASSLGMCTESEGRGEVHRKLLYNQKQ